MRNKVIKVVFCFLITIFLIAGSSDVEISEVEIGNLEIGNHETGDVKAGEAETYDYKDFKTTESGGSDTKEGENESESAENQSKRMPVKETEMESEETDAVPESEGNLVEFTDVGSITHIFFHSLIADTKRAFNSAEAAGYNQVMTTLEEFEKIMQQMYDRGYILVDIKDVANRVVNEDGSESMIPGTLMLPEGKKPFVLSIDDVSYYEYMEGDGFASKIVLDENNKPVSLMILEDGTTVFGDYDVVPWLETFISKNPDFSYNGARGIIALTGYNGVLGYRTAPSYNNLEDYDQQTADAAKVSDRLKELGWKFASHSYGHLNYGDISYDKMVEDCGKWEDTVAPIVGDTDILIYPFGADIGDWTRYRGEKFDYLYGMGFRYFCNVDSARSWLQIGDKYMRQGRRNIDGYRMYHDLISEDTNLLSDLFEVKEVFDSSRPLPVPDI